MFTISKSCLSSFFLPHDLRVFYLPSVAEGESSSLALLNQEFTNLGKYLINDL